MSSLAELAGPGASSSESVASSGSSTGGIGRPTRLLWSVGIVLLVTLLVFNSVVFGLRVGPMGHPLFVWPGEVDYSRGQLRALAPLRDFFIERILGRSTTRSDANSGGSLIGQSAGRRQSGLPGPEVVSHPLTNDLFNDAYAISSLPFTARTSSDGAGREPGEPSNCAPLGATVWYRFVAPSDVGLIADTFGTDRPASLTVFRGNDIGSLQELGCTTHPRGNARVAFPVVKGESYYFQVASVSGGQLVFSARIQGFTKRPSFADDYAGIGTALSLDGRHMSFFAFRSPTGRSENYCLGFVHGTASAPSAVCRAQGYVFDTQSEKVVMVSVSSRGEPANDSIVAANTSADGRYVSMAGWATNLVEGDTNVCAPSSWLPGSCLDVFVHDRDADANGVFDETFPGARKTVRVSVGSDGRQGNGSAGPSYVSPDGRYVFFQSWATNLIDDDTNGTGDIYRHDRDADGNGIFDETFPGARKTIRVSVASDGSQTQVDVRRAADQGAIVDGRDRVPFEVGNHYLGPSANGRYVMFRSPARNLDSRCTNGAYHVYVHDTTTRETTCVSLDSRGRQANKSTRLHNSFGYKVSDDGRFAIFNSDATNLVEGDTNGEEDVFVRDLVAGTTERVTVTWDGGQAQGEGASSGREAMIGLVFTSASLVAFEDIYTTSELSHTMTPDGRYVFFGSGAHNLVPGDVNEARDSFVRDLHRGTTTLVSVSTTGQQGDLSSQGAFPTRDGQLVAFYSLARNLDERRQEPDLGLSVQMYLRSLPGGP